MPQTVEQRLQELLNRKPSRWSNLSLAEFTKDITLLTDTVRQQQSQIVELQINNKQLSDGEN